MPQQSSPATIGFPFIELRSVDSTNNYAMARIHAGLAQHGMAFFAHDQTAGKGQRGKTWLAQPDANISLSLVLQPHCLLVNEQFKLNACIAVAVHRFFSHYADDETSIKWPNDIYWRDRKAGGVLIENLLSADGKWHWAVAGIGININQTYFDEDLKNPVSLRQITGKTFNPAALAKEVCRFVNESYGEITAGNFQNILHYYNHHLYKKEQSVRLRKANRVFEAVIKKVENDGRLLIYHAVDEWLNFGEVEWVI